ncbi:MAG: tetratricopeptide repeat protein [Desulfobacterales bacterium]
MKTTPFAENRVFLILNLAAIFILLFSPALAQATPAADVVVRIARIEQNFDIVDELFASDDRQGEAPPSAQLRGMLMGTHWIDPDRAMVIGVNFHEDQVGKEPDMAALVPFIEPNDDFAATHGAVKKTGHYLISMQEDTSVPVSPELASALAQEAKQPGEDFVTVDIAVPRILNKADNQIKQLLALIEEQAAGARQEGPETVSPEEFKIIAGNFLEVCRQMETLSFGVDINRRNTAFSMEILAQADTEMAEVLTKTTDAPKGRLGNFMPDSGFQLQFRSRPYDTAATSGFMAKYFGEFYKVMGIDLEQIMQTFSAFTGEMAGAMSIDPPDMKLEAVCVLASGQKQADDFLQSEYIPRLLELGEQMAKFYKEQYPDLELDSVFSKTKDSEIGGRHVAGIEMRLPVINPETGKTGFLNMPARMTTVDDYLLTASDDKSMRSLIQNVSEMAPAETEGPLMNMSMDLAGLIKAAAAMSQQQENIELPGFISDMGELVYTVELQGHSVRAAYSMKSKDIRRLVESMEAIGKQTRPEANIEPSDAGQGGKPSSQAVKQSSGKAMTADQPGMLSSGITVKEKPDRKKGQELSEDDSLYWMEKGGLYAAYGNEDAAIESYQKALELDPENSRAAFNLGLAYADRREFGKALDFINQALYREPENDNYLYGRGWVHLQADRHEKAMKDISRAAELGNPDAQRYITAIAQRQKAGRTD